MAWEILRGHPGIIPAPYLGRYKWVQIQRASALDEADTFAYIKAAHALVSAKLTKKVRQQLGLV